MVALGAGAAGVYSNDDDLWKTLDKVISLLINEKSLEFFFKQNLILTLIIESLKNFNMLCESQLKFL